MITGYKVFNSDFTCRDVKFEVGETYEHNGEVKLCQSGFHFCLNAADCFLYYELNSNNIVCEVECDEVSEEKENDSKRVCRKITIKRRLEWNEVLDICNTGTRNTGIRNTGSYNSGNSNSGNYNSGNYNSGDYNSGDYNSGYYNSGNYNSGYYNSGYYNSGDYNSGDYNSGYYNSGYHNSGNSNSGNSNSGNRNSGNYNSCNGVENNFCTITQKGFIFNKPTDVDFTIPFFPLKLGSVFIHKSKMTEQEKLDNPNYLTTQGYVKTYNHTYKEAFVLAWSEASEENKCSFFNLPNFDKDIFFEITGVDLTNDIDFINWSKN